MRFLLVAPEDPSIVLRLSPGQRRSRGATPAADGTQVDALLYRHLEQEYVSSLVERQDLEAPAGFPAANALLGGEVSVLQVRRYRCLDSVIWTAVIEAPTADLLDGPTAGVEEALSSLATAVFSQHGCGRLLWVSRTLVHDDAHGPDRSVRGWLERSHEQGRPSAPDYVVDDGEFTIGWGNTLLRGRCPDALLELVEASLVLAQILWSRVHGLSEAAGDALLTGIALGHGRDRRGGRAFAGRVESLSEELGIHHMLTDEFTHNNQGAILTTRILETWGFSAFQDSTRRRIADLRGMASDIRTRQNVSYQRTVEWILIAIGLIAVLDVAVGTVQLAFSGGVTDVPGEGSTLALLTTIRGLGADVALLVGLAVVSLLVVATLAVVTRLRDDGR
jgi:hypothetical protein